MATNLPTTEPTEQLQPQHSGETKSSTPPSAEHSPRQLWQIPLFLCGLVALVVAGWLRPFAGDPSLRQLQRDLQHVREALTRPHQELQAAWPTAEGLLRKVQDHPDRAGEIYFLAGSAQVRLAEAVQGRSARQHWRDARSYLEQAKKHRVPDADRHRLAYRIAKTTLYLNEDPELAVEQLKASADHADKLSESYRLLTQAYLQLPKPDLEAALSANEKLRMVPLLNEEVLAPARLQAGELLLRMERTEEARKVLETIGSQSPADILVQSRILRARSFQEEQRWSEAAALWQAALADGGAPVPEEGRILFDLGTCYQRLDQPVEAARTWKQCIEQAKGSEAQAAAIALAELSLAKGQPEQAMLVLKELNKSVKAPADWKSSLVKFHRVEKVYEQTTSSLQTAGAFEQAAQLSELFAPLAEKGKAERLKAESLQQWARSRIAQAKSLNDADMLAKETKAAHVLYEQASAAFLKAAAKAGSPEQELADVWQANICLGEAGKHDKQKAVLDRFLENTTDRQQLGQAWYALGESLRLSKQPGAEEAYRNCILQAASPWVYRARYQLAMMMKARGDLDNAEAELLHNLKLLGDDPDRVAQEKSLFALGHLFYERKNYRMVVRWMEGALQRFASNPQNTQARFELAESYRRLAAQENQAFINTEMKDEKVRQHYQEEHRIWLTKAAEEFLTLAKLLDTTASVEGLSMEDRVQVPFIAAECRFNLGQYEDALQIYGHLAERYRGRLEALPALGGIVRCHAALGQPEQLRTSLKDIREALAQVDPEIRASWEQWLTVASKPLQ